MIPAFFAQPWIERLGWTLLHFLWQGTVIALIYAEVKHVFARHLSPGGRYALSCTALALMAAAPPMTFLAISSRTGIPAHGAALNITSAEAARILPLMVALWAAGVAWFSIRLVGAWRFTQRLRSISHPAPAEWQHTLERIALRVAPNSPARLQRVRLVVSSLVDVPTVVGWLRPLIMTPVAFLSDMPVSYVEALLAHELAHIRRHDYIASIVQNIVEAVLFYHPAVWWISGQIRAEREVCCDDLAVAATRDVATYARALASLESRQVARAGLQLAANGGALLARIRRLVEPNARPNDLPETASAGAMVLLWALGVGVAAVHGAPAVVPLHAVSAAIAQDRSSKPSPYSEPLLFDPVFPVQMAQSRPPALPSPPAASKPAFELADVHVSAHSDNPSLRVFHRDGRYELLGATMVDLISTAYGVKANTVAGGPSWMESDRFDVIAKASDDASADALHAMLQALLQDRFGLAVHNDTRQIPALVLTAGNPLRIKQTQGPAGGGCEEVAAEHTPALNAVWHCRNVTMHEFADVLTASSSMAQARGYIANREVADQTGLSGAWDFDLKWTGNGLLARAGADGVTLFDAIDKQLGMRLEMGTAPLPALAVDKVNEKPSANLPGVTEKLPPLRLQFDVVDIKKSTQDAPTAPKFTAGGRMEVKGVALIALIQHAWGLDTYDNDLIVGGPKTLTTERFDIVATATPPDGPASLLKDDDSTREMLRTMLADRFKLALHTEAQPVNVLVLKADKLKMKPADPSERSRCTESVAPSAAGGVPQRRITCANTTPAEFAERLHGLLPQYPNRPVVDGTGIDGAFDFSIVYSTPRLVQAANAAADTPATASDPNGAVTLFEALEKQLGLTLATEKRSWPVLVIDHVQQTPTDN